MLTPTTTDKLYVLVFRCTDCGRPILHSYWSKVFSRADVEGTAFVVGCPGKCRSPDTLPGRRARYIFEVSWGPDKGPFQLPKWV
jgi:hypothetical protein